MDSSPEVAARRRALEREAPFVSRGVWRRTAWNGRDVVFLCGTLGAAFDTWQRRLSLLSAADALLSQQLGLDAVEREMDRLEGEARAAVEAEGKRLLPRRSPGYGDLPLGLSREILVRLDATRRIGVSVTDANLLVPSKSVTAVCEVAG
ncbi:MAG: hypothetical protein MJ249_11275 [Kiritimatiellae bacterium]|nr:hypothetical protein [Kiritimatiellia bacterium]